MVGDGRWKREEEESPRGFYGSFTFKSYGSGHFKFGRVELPSDYWAEITQLLGRVFFFFFFGQMLGRVYGAIYSDIFV